MKWLIFFLPLTLICSFSIADVHSKTSSHRAGRKLDLRLTKKTAATFDEAQNRNDGYEKIDMSQFKQFETTASKPKTKMNCKSRDGITYKQNEAGFDNCLRQAELEKSSSHHKPSDPNSSSVGAEFNLDN